MIRLVGDGISRWWDMRLVGDGGWLEMRLIDGGR